jgi:hypothetical protein
MPFDAFVSTIPSRIATVLTLFWVRSHIQHSPRRVRFGAFELDLSTGELRLIEAPDPSNPSPNGPSPNNKNKYFRSCRCS